MSTVVKHVQNNFSRRLTVIRISVRSNSNLFNTVMERVSKCWHLRMKKKVKYVEKL